MQPKQKSRGELFKVAMKHLQGFIAFDNFPNGVEVSSITDFYKLIVGYCAHLNFFKSSRSVDLVQFKRENKEADLKSHFSTHFVQKTCDYVY